MLVSILTYNGNDKTIKTIADVYSQECSEIKINIVVIDNNSSNSIVDRIKYNFPNINIILNKVNNGYSAGNNIAINLALKIKADFLFVLNDDLELMPNYIHEMINTGIYTDDAAAFGSTIRLSNEKIQATYGSLSPWFAGLIWHNCKLNNSKNGVRQVDAVQGAAIVLTKTALQRGFRFDECLFFGGEEFDLSCWARLNSLKIYLLEHVEVVHNTSQKQLILDRWHADPIHFYYAIRNCFYIKRKYSKSNFEYILAMGYSSARVLSKGLLFALKGDVTAFQFMIRGIWDGVVGKMGKLDNNHQR